jgi:ribosomal protein L29
MSLPKYSELKDLTTSIDIDQEILILQKKIFDFKMQKSKTQAVKPHLYVHAKRRISQLKFKKSFLLKNNSN